MSKQLPTWLIEALESDDRPTGSLSSELQSIYPGDIVIVESAGGPAFRRHVLVLDADTQTQLLSVCLLSNETTLASDQDIRLAPDLTGAAYELMVETQLHTKVLWSQAKASTGSIEDSLLDDILDFIWDERPARLEPLRGLPSSHKTSARLDFETQELLELKRLSWCETPTPSQGPGVYVDASVLLTMDEEPTDPDEMSALLNLWKQIDSGGVHFYLVQGPGARSLRFEPKGPEQRAVAERGHVSGFLLQSVGRGLLSSNCRIETFQFGPDRDRRTVLLGCPSESVHMGEDRELAHTRMLECVYERLSEQVSRRRDLVGVVEDGSSIVPTWFESHA